MSSSEDEPLIVRKTDLNDDVISSPNAIIAQAMVKLGYVFTDAGRIAKGYRMLDAVRGQMEKFPGWYTCWANTALMEAFGAVQLEVCGPQAGTTIGALRKQLPHPWYWPGAATAHWYLFWKQKARLRKRSTSAATSFAWSRYTRQRRRWKCWKIFTDWKTNKPVWALFAGYARQIALASDRKGQPRQGYGW